MADTNAVDAKVRFSKNHLSALTPDDEDDDDYSESLDAIMRRRESSHRRSFRHSPKRGSSPFGSDSESGGKGRRRSSTMTSTSCEETQISIEEPEMTEEQIFESIRLHKELIEQMNKQPWKLKKRLKIVRRAKAFVRKNEGDLEQRLAQSKNTKDIMARYNLILLRYWERLKREAANLAKNLIPWEMRIKMIESHFGSVVASYFVFLRWVFWINIVMSVFISCFVIIPEVLAADRMNAGDRKEMLPDEEARAFNLQTLWDFEGILKYSPIFYGYYTNTEKTRQGYRLPLAYFMTLLGMYGYSFAAILRRMAENTRLNKLSDKDEDCTFTWKLFTGWDYIIGHSETADNKVASILMGFKENILEEREKKKEERNWKIICLRILANFIVIILLASSAYAVVLVVARTKEPAANSNWWRQNETEDLEQLRPNTTLAPLTTTAAANFITASHWPQHNDSFMPVLEKLNQSVNYQLFQWNSTCVAYRTDCGPNAFVVPTNSSYVTPTSSPFSSTDSLMGMLDAAYLLSTLDPWSNLTGILNSSLSLSALANFTFPPSSSSVLFPPDTSPSNWTETPVPWVSGPIVNATARTRLDRIRQSRTRLDKFGQNQTRSDRFVQNRMRVGKSRQEDRLEKKRGRGRGSSKNKTSKDVSPEVTSRTPLWSDVYHFTPNKLQGRSDALIGTTVAWTNQDDYDDTLDVDDTVTSTLPSWNDSDVQMDWPDSSTPYPNYDNMDDGFVGMAPSCCIVIICFQSGDFINQNLSCDDDDAISSEAWPSIEPTTMVPDTTISKLNFSLDSSVPVEDSVHSNATSDDEIDLEKKKELRKLCWETMFGQELVKLTIMDLVMTTASILITDFIRALIVRIMNHCCCWDLEKQFPGYGDFKIAENILHLVNNQGMIWMGMFFSPGIPGINMVKIVILMYIRSWAVLTCNIPHETVFKASNSSNFYYSLLLMMLFLCTLPVGYAVVWLRPSWHCGPFSQYDKIYGIFTSSLKSVLPNIIIRGLDYAASPGIIIPLLVLLILIIYYLNSVANSLRETNKDLKDQLRRERTVERRKVFQMADARHDPPNSASKWMVMKKILPVLPSKVKLLQVATQQLKHQAHSCELKPFQKEDDKKTKKQLSEDENSEAVLANAIKANCVKLPKEKLLIGIHKLNKEGGKVAEKNAENEKNTEEAKAKENPDSEMKNTADEEKKTEKDPSKTLKPKEYEY